jgi:hypothetical protein
VTLLVFSSKRGGSARRARQGAPSSSKVKRLARYSKIAGPLRSMSPLSAVAPSGARRCSMSVTEVASTRNAT